MPIKKQNEGQKFYGNKLTDGNQVQKMELSQLKAFEEQPFKVNMDKEMDELVASIKEFGVMTPIIVRPHKDGGYEILSGHRRAKACELIGKEKVPVIVKELDDDMATILLVDSNLQRENILLSEKAHAYRMKMEALRRKAGRPSQKNGDQFGHHFEGRKSVDLVAENSPDSRNQIQRYIRLTELVDPLMEMVDEKKLPMNAAVELSYLGTKAQADVVKTIEENEAMPSIEQAAQIRRASTDGKVDTAVIKNIMQEVKPVKYKIVLREDKLSQFFPPEYTAKEIEDVILTLLKGWARKRSKKHDIEH